MSIAGYWCGKTVLDSVIACASVICWKESVNVGSFVSQFYNILYVESVVDTSFFNFWLDWATRVDRLSMES